MRTKVSLRILLPVGIYFSRNANLDIAVAINVIINFFVIFYI